MTTQTQKPSVLTASYVPKINILTRGRRVFKPFSSWSDLTPFEQARFPRLNTREKQNKAIFLRYKEMLFDLDDFQPAPENLKRLGYDAIKPVTLDTGFLVTLATEARQFKIFPYWYGGSR